jgi:hypothetical protein
MMMRSLLFLMLWGLSVQLIAQSPNRTERETFEKWLVEAQTLRATGASTEKLIQFFAKKQLGIPYKAGLLEVPAMEQLVVTLEGSDCVLFVEHSLALTLTTMQGSTHFDDLARNIALLRYQQGLVDGYASRLHYFSDWLQTNQEKGLLSVLHQSDETLPVLKPVDFMSKNRSAYPQLSASDSLFTLLKERETALANRTIRYIPQQRITEFESTFQTGDILSFVTTINGLDIAHTALIVREGSRVGFYHASTTGKVMKDPKTIFEYTRDRKNVNGIIVARLGS